MPHSRPALLRDGLTVRPCAPGIVLLKPLLGSIVARGRAPPTTVPSLPCSASPRLGIALGGEQKSTREGPAGRARMRRVHPGVCERQLAILM